MKWLKEILGDSYTDEIAEAVKKKIGEDFVARDDFNDVNEKKKELKEQLDQRDAQLEELKKVDPEGLKAKIEELETKNQEAAEKYEQDLAKRDYEIAAERFVDGLKPKDALSKKAILLEFKSKEFKKDDDGFQGAKEWAEQFKKDNASHFQGASDKTGMEHNPGGEGEKTLADEITSEIFGK